MNRTRLAVGAVVTALVVAGAVAAVELGGNPLASADSSTGNTERDAGGGQELDTVAVERGSGPKL